MTSKLLNLIVFFLPLYLIKFKIGFVPFNVLEIAVWLVFLFWLIQKKYIDIEIFKHQNIILSSLLILLGAIFSTLFSQNISVGAGILKGWFLAPMSFGLMVFAEAKDKKNIQYLLGALFASAAVAAAAALILHAFGRLTFDGRLAAFYASPNYLAMYLAPGFLTGVGLWGLPAARETKTALFGGLILIGVALYLTYSYAAWIAVLIALGVLHLAAGGSRRKRLAYAIFFLVLIGALLFSQFNGEKLSNLLNSERSSWQSRLMIWQAAFEIIKDQPIFGIGPGMFGRYYLKYQSRFPVPYLEWAAPQPHNVFLAFWLQAGILGLIGFLWLLAVFFKKIWPQIKQQDQLALTLLLLMLYTILHGLVDATYWKNDLSIIFWLIVALAVATSSVPGYKQIQSGDQ